MVLSEGGGIQQGNRQANEQQIVAHLRGVMAGREIVEQYRKRPKCFVRKWVLALHNTMWERRFRIAYAPRWFRCHHCDRTFVERVAWRERILNYFDGRHSMDFLRFSYSGSFTVNVVFSWLLSTEIVPS